jgi:hypothetical protein
MSSMMPQGQMPPQLQALLAQMGQGGGPSGPPEQSEPGEGDWLVNAINSVHNGMVQESDPKQVSLLGAILNQLTTFQANRANAGAQGQQAGG